MKKSVKTGLLYVSAAMLMAGCSQGGSMAVTTVETQPITEQASGSQYEAGYSETTAEDTEKEIETNNQKKDTDYELTASITLSDDGIMVDGNVISENPENAVYAANDIVYYEEGKDFTYGEGTEDEAHSKAEAEAHTVIHITKPGVYEVSGKLSAGQIAVNLGEDAKKDPEAVVTLILNGVDITCTVAPGVIFYEVYECDTNTEDTASAEVDTTKAGANVIIADGTENYVNGSYVARIYKSVELNDEGTEVIESKKLHKYDGAFYSKMSMNLDGGTEGTGILHINAENEGLDSERHLTLNGGNINIISGNDGINTNEDGVSVTTINGGMLQIRVDGSTGEGDGIDSNGWLVINGGTVIAEACGFSMDAGIDSDKGIHINGGIVIASGNMLDHISDSEQNYAVFSFAERQEGGQTYSLKHESGEICLTAAPENVFSTLILSISSMTDGMYSLWTDETLLAGMLGEGGFRGFRGGMMPPSIPEDFEPSKMPDDFDPSQMPEERPQGGGRPGGRGPREEMPDTELSTEFTISTGGNYYRDITKAE